MKQSMRCPIVSPVECLAPVRAALMVVLLWAAVPLGAQPAQQLGRVEFANSGAAEAQAAFQAGVAALHSFFYDEAADLFREAQRIDPDFALAYWGEALTYNHPLWQQQDLAAARAVMERLAPSAEGRAANAGSERERDYLVSLDVLYGEGDKLDRDRRYAEALEALAARYRSDLDAQAFWALALQGMQRPGSRDARLNMRSAAIVEEVFAANPRHPGAAHYLIHAYDDPIHAPLGLRAARVYAEIAPAANHALHMPAHIFVQLGMWHDAAVSNEAAWAASVAWAERRGHPPTRHDFHSLSWLQYAYHQLGRHADAARTLERIEPVAAAFPDDPRVAGTLALMRARLVVESPAGGALAADAFGADGDWYGSQAAALFGAGWAALGRDDPAAAAALADRLADLVSAAGEGYGARAPRVMELELRGALALAAGDAERGLDLLRQAAELEASLETPSGPPIPIKPAQEFYGEALLAADRAAEADEWFGRSLLRTPGRSASLVGAARAAAAVGDAERSRRACAQLVESWRAADPDVPLAAQARACAAAVPGTAMP